MGTKINPPYPPFFKGGNPDLRVEDIAHVAWVAFLFRILALPWHNGPRMATIYRHTGNPKDERNEMKYRYEIVEKSVCYEGFFRLERYRLRHELFGGGWGGDIVREVLQRGHAAAALLYDPELDCVVLLEQFRVGALDSPSNPWLLEVVAGIIEEGENPDDVVRREAVEEAGCVIQELLPVSVFTLSPGGCSEQIHMFCARVDASATGGIHGLAHEGEDIQVRVVRFEEAMGLLQTGKVCNATAIIALQWLALHRDEVRTRWGIGKADCLP